MKKTIITLLLLFPVFLFAQETAAQNKQKSEGLTVTEKLEKYRGTIQIQIKDARLKAAIPYNIDTLIEDNRTENTVVYLALGTDVRVMILPKSAVSGNTKINLYSTY